MVQLVARPGILILIFVNSLVQGSTSRPAPPWSWLDHLKVHWCHRNSEQPPRWSKPLVIFRASDGKRYHKNPLANVNAGNLSAQLSYLSEGKHHPATYCHTTLSAYRITINPDATSEYFHCSRGACEFRISSRYGLLTTPLSEISATYSRVGIKDQFLRIQVSVASQRAYAGPGDVCSSREIGTNRIARCSEATRCYFALPAAGLFHSYLILAEAHAPLDWQGDLEAQLRALASEVGTQGQDDDCDDIS